jgi:tetratricopeptide (TPR) repeat protein
VNALAQLGFVTGERGDLAEAERLFRRALALSDKHFYAYYDLGRLLVKARRYEEALPLLRRGAEIKPDNAGVHYQQFIALSRLKRAAEAERALAVFKRLEEARKLRRQQGLGEDDEDLSNPPAANAPAEPPPG